jgi:hypothetical protein
MPKLIILFAQPPALRPRRIALAGQALHHCPQAIDIVGKRLGAFVTRNVAADSISHSSHDVAVGRLPSRACSRGQSIPSINAANWAGVSRITPSLIGGHLKAPCSSRFYNRISPEPSHATKHEDRARERILGQRLAHQCDKAVSTLSKINRSGGHQHP